MINCKNSYKVYPVNKPATVTLQLVCFLILLLCPIIGFTQDYDYDNDKQAQDQTKEQDDYDIEDYQPPPNNIVKTSFSSLLVSQNLLTGEFRLGYEFAPWPKLATFVSVSIHYPNPAGLAFIEEAEDTINSVLQNNTNVSQDVQLQMIGYRVQVGQKFYLLESPKIEAPEGLYIGPLVSFSETKVSFKDILPDYFTKITYLSANLMIGYQFVFGDNIALDLATGLRYRYNYYNYSDTDKKMDEVIKGPFENKQKGLFFMNQIHFGIGFNF